MKVYGYLRVSTEKQVDGFSLEAQKAKVNSYAESEGLKVNQWCIDEGVSGSVLLRDRSQGSTLLTIAKQGDVVICSKLDRMFRSASDALSALEEFKSAGITLHIIDIGGNCINGVGKLVFTVLSAVSEMERDRLKERISDAKAQMRQEGKYQGGKVPFGYFLDNGELRKNREEQKYIKFMARKRAEGMSYRKISKLLNDDWDVSLSHNAIRNLLKGDRKTPI